MNSLRLEAMTHKHKKGITIGVQKKLQHISRTKVKFTKKISSQLNNVMFWFVEVPPFVSSWDVSFTEVEGGIPSVVSPLTKVVDRIPLLPNSNHSPQLFELKKRATKTNQVT